MNKQALLIHTLPDATRSAGIALGERFYKYGYTHSLAKGWLHLI